MTVLVVIILTANIRTLETSNDELDLEEEDE